MKRVNLFDLLTINSYWVGLSFMWNGLHVIILPAILLHYAPAGLKNTYLGLLTFTGLLIAMLVQPISGALSDRWSSRWGRRRPLILIGTLFDFVFLATLGWVGGLAWVVVGYIGLQLSSNLAHGPLQGLLPDIVPPEQLGAGSGIKNFMDMLGLVLSSLFLGRLLDPTVLKPTVPMTVVIGVLALSGAITLLWTRESPSRQGVAPTEKTVPESKPLQISRAYTWLIGSRFLFLLGVYGIQAFAQYYILDVLKAPNAAKLTGDLLASITLALIAFALLGGALGDRIGHRRVHYLASGVCGVGCTLMVFARTPASLLAIGSVVGVGIGLFLTANWALANLMAPRGEAGKYLGLTNLATAGAGASVRLAGPLIDLLNNAWTGVYAGYVGLFLFAALCTLASGVVVYRTQKGGEHVGIPL